MRPRFKSASTLPTLPKFITLSNKPITEIFPKLSGNPAGRDFIQNGDAARSLRRQPRYIRLTDTEQFRIGQGGSCGRCADA